MARPTSIGIDRRIRTRPTLVGLLVAAGLFFWPASAFAGWDCEGALGDPRSAANLDLYNGVLFLGAAAALDFGVEVDGRWSAVNSLDDGARSAFRLDTPSARGRADRASDATLGVGFFGLPLASILAQQMRTGDCAESWDMTTDVVESFGLALMLSETIKQVSGRARPFVRGCGLSPPSDSQCRGSDRFESFVSGHATLAATGAGLTCAFSLKRRAFGDTLLARAAPCTAGVGLALTTGGLRLSADRHWLTDILAGLALGGTIGWFDTWGPFDGLLVKTEIDPELGLRSARYLLPASVEGRPGIRFGWIF